MVWLLAQGRNCWDGQGVKYECDSAKTKQPSYGPTLIAASLGFVGPVKSDENNVVNIRKGSRTLGALSDFPADFSTGYPIGRPLHWSLRAKEP